MRTLGRKFQEFDFLLIGSALALTAVGTLLIYSAQHQAPVEAARQLWVRQLIWIAVALVAFVVAVWLPLRIHEVFAYVYLGVTCIILLGLLWLNPGGGERWIAVGPFHVQPSEPAKLALLFALSRYLGYLKRPVFGWRPLAGLFLLVMPVWMLVLKQPDLGTSLVFWALLLVLIFWAGASPIAIFFLISPALSLILAFNWMTWILFLAILLIALYVSRTSLLKAVGVVVINTLFGIITPMAWNRLLPYQKLRILAFIDPGSDPRGAGYQIIQSKVAIGSGGFWGKGFLEGTQTGLHFLPEKHTDFIFSVAAEEFGFWGALIILFLFAVFLWRTIEAGYLARNRFGRFLAVGAAAIVAFQMLINIGMTIGFMPVTGLPLPFLSYGGSSLVSFWVLTGLIVNVRRHWQDY